MARVFDQVQQAIEARISEFSEVPLDPATGRMLVSFENDRFQPLDGAAWWRVNFMPSGAPTRGSYGEEGYSRADGEVIVDLFYPAGEGSGEARRAADDLIAHFKSGTRITSIDDVVVSIWRAWRAPGITEPRWYHIPVHIWWTVHRSEL
jgi:hypothetical protein